MPDINPSSANGQIAVFENGGTLTIKDGGTSYNVLHIVKGTLSYEPGGYERNIVMDRGVIKKSLQLDEQTTKVSLSVLHTTSVAAGEIINLSKASPVNGFEKEYVVEVFIPDYRGAATGKKITFGRAIFNPCKFSAGDRFDKLDLEFIDLEPSPTEVRV